MAKKKVPSKKAVKQSIPAKPPIKKEAARKGAAPKKKSAVKKKPVKGAVPKSTASGPVTTVIAQADVGWGNHIYLRGEGGGLSWEKGVMMDCREGNEWVWSTNSAANGLTFKFLLNDEIWAEGEDLTVPAGGTSVSSPAFHL